MQSSLDHSVQSMSLAASLPSSPAAVRRAGVRGEAPAMLTSHSAPSTPASARRSLSAARHRHSATATGTSSLPPPPPPPSARPGGSTADPEESRLFTRSKSQEEQHAQVVEEASLWMANDPAAAAAAVWANRTQPLFSKGLMEALREKGTVTSFLDIAGGTPDDEPEPEPECSIEEEMKSLRSRLKQARDEIRASTVEAIGCRNDLKEVRHKGHRRLTRKSSLEDLNNNGGRWNNRPAAVSTITNRHMSASSHDSRDSADDDDEYDDDEYEGSDGYDTDGSQSDSERDNFVYTAADGSRSTTLILPTGAAWATSSKKSLAGRRRRRHKAERKLGGYQESLDAAAADAAGERIFDGSAASPAAAAAAAAELAGARKSRLGEMMSSLRGTGSAVNMFNVRGSPVSQMAGHGGMPSSPKPRRRKKKAANGGGGSPKGSPKGRRKKKGGGTGSPRKRGGKAANKGHGSSSSSSSSAGINSGVKPSVSMPSSSLSRSFSANVPMLPASVKSHSAPSSPRVSRRGADQAPSPSQIANAIAAKKSNVRKANLMMQSPTTSRNSSSTSLLALAPKLSAMMQMRESPSTQTASG